MSAHQNSHYPAPDPRTVISALWVAMLFAFAYVDIFSFYRADVLRGALDGKVASANVTIDQGFLVFATVYVLPAILMVPLSLLLPHRLNGIIQVVVAGLYAISIIALAVGEEWHYYVIGSVFEVVLLAEIIRRGVARTRAGGHAHQSGPDLEPSH